MLDMYSCLTERLVIHPRSVVVVVNAVADPALGGRPDRASAISGGTAAW
jgi:hypothetical protein